MKYTPGLMVGQLSGKAGSTVASRNKAGSYFRTKTTPKLVQNANTSANRSSFSTLASLWRTITSAQRGGWRNLGASMTRTDSLGNVYTLTGLQAYESVNRNIATYGGSTVADAPAFTPPAGLVSVTVTASSV